MISLQARLQHYAWGSKTAIPELFGLASGEQPIAEYWLGAHPSSPSLTANHIPLDQIIAEHPELLGRESVERFGTRLPYLLKVLAAEKPLSIQAHPSRAQAEEGFARENAAGIERTAPTRNYVDDWPKPEMIVALTEFDALCGFRSPAETYSLFQALGATTSLEPVIGPLNARSGAAAIAEVFLDTLTGDASRTDMVSEVVAAAVRHRDDVGPLGDFARTAIQLDNHFPGQPSILSALLMNRVRLQPGEALFLDAGLLHSYLHGTGVEIMANSDNVLRGGLTPKHIDVAELVSVVSFDPSEAAKVERVEDARGLIRYVTPAPEFALWQVALTDIPVTLPTAGARILLVLAGEATVRSGEQEEIYGVGQACFLSEAEHEVTVVGHGKAVLAGPGLV